MANQVRFQTKFDFLADGVSNTLLFNLLRVPVFNNTVTDATDIGHVDGVFDQLANPFGGTTELPKTVTATGGAALGTITTSIDTWGNVLLTFSSTPAANSVQTVVLTLLFG